MEEDLVEKFRETEKIVNLAEARLSDLRKMIEKTREELKKEWREKAETTQLAKFDKDLVEDFLEEPYVILPKKKEEWWVIAPKFVDFQIGWLERSTKGYNIFIVNKYMDWLAHIPQKVRSLFKFKPKLPLKVFDGFLLTGREHQDTAWERYKKHLTRREGEDRIRIKRGHEFRLIAQIIEDGMLPFIPQPIDEKDLREPAVKFELRDYQKEAWKKFLEVGAIGVYWPFSAGKTFLGMYALASIKGRKLVIVPTVTLKEQWLERLEKYTSISSEVEVETYYAFNKLKNREYNLVIFDECHRLPANTFARLATLKTKYRIGLSGTPYREDGRTDYIFALTGFPTGLDWQTLLDLGVFKKPDITLFVVPSLRAKLEKTEELLREPKKTLIFCDSIDLGKKIAKHHGIPHVYGDTRKRMDVLRASQVTVVSRVGDEGVSLPDIERVIEVDFLYGSRRQEAQRMGRLFHGANEGEHYILMTEEELEKYEKRLYAIYEKGWRINIIR